MAAVTVTGQRNVGNYPVGFTTGYALRGAGIAGLRPLVFDVAVTTSGDTWATGRTDIKAAAWIADNTSDPIAITHSAGTLTFTGTNGSTGKCILYV